MNKELLLANLLAVVFALGLVVLLTMPFWTTLSIGESVFDALDAAVDINIVVNGKEL